jgi:crotonobetainyl-CoA:carnitine CoA-transferase CaiB-like acyl-CoA transferase
MLMADLGVDIIKIELPEVGDNSRTSGQVDGYPSSYFETNNRGVKSLTHNLKDPRGKEILYKLVAQADVFGQTFRPGAAEKNGFGYVSLKKINPKLVYASISGYRPAPMRRCREPTPWARRWEGGRRSIFYPS